MVSLIHSHFIVREKKCFLCFTNVVRRVLLTYDCIILLSRDLLTLLLTARIILVFEVRELTVWLNWILHDLPKQETKMPSSRFY